MSVPSENSAWLRLGKQLLRLSGNTETLGEKKTFPLGADINCNTHVLQ